MQIATEDIVYSLLIPIGDKYKLIMKMIAFPQVRLAVLVIGALSILPCSSLPSSFRSLREGTDPWYLERVGDVHATFDATSSPEVEINYEIHNGKARFMEIALYEEDCATLITDESISVASQEEDDTQDASSNSLTVYKVLLDVNEAVVYDSEVWFPTTGASNDEGEIRFCVGAQLVQNGETVNVYETLVMLEVTLEEEFGATATGSASAVQDAATKVAVIDYSIASCPCDENLDCYSTPQPVTLQSILRLCIWSQSSEVLVETLPTLELWQDSDGDPATDPVLIRTPISSATPDFLTTVNVTDGVAVVETRITTAFFSDPNNPRDIEAVGIARLLFRGLRSRVLRRTTATRSLAENFAGTGAFRVQIPLSPVEDDGGKSSVPIIAGVIGSVMAAGLFVFAGFWLKKLSGPLDAGDRSFPVVLKVKEDPTNRADESETTLAEHGGKGFVLEGHPASGDDPLGVENHVRMAEI